MSEPTSTWTPVVDLPEPIFRVWSDGYLQGRLSGLADGFRDGWAASDRHADSIHRAALDVVRAAASWQPSPERIAADHAAAQRSSQWWAAKRGEVA